MRWVNLQRFLTEGVETTTIIELYWHINNYWFTSGISTIIEYYLATGIHAAQVRISGCVPKSYTSICSTSTGCQESMNMRRPCNCFHSSRMLTIFQDRLCRMLVPNKKLHEIEKYKSLITHPKIIIGDMYINYLPCYHFHQMLIRDYHMTT